VTTLMPEADAGGPEADAGGPDADNVLAALDVAPAMVRDLDGTIRFWSRGAERLYGWSRSEAVGGRSHELLATQWPQPPDAIQAVLFADGAWRGELRHRTRDGRTLVVASLWTLQRTSDGRPTRVVEVNHDIGFQQPEITAMRRLAAIVESSNDAIIGKDLNGIVTHWNHAAEAMFGYRAEDIVGQSIIVLFPPDRVAEEAMIMERLRRGEKVEHYETVRQRKDGSTVPVSLSVSPIRDEAGAIIGASKILRDLSDQHDRERRLREAQAELFHVQRLTELGQLISALVHEVNQPLSAIGNYAAAGKRLLAAANTGAAATALLKITEQTERAHQIIQRLRNFVKKSDSAQRTEHLPALIQDGAALAMVILTKENVALETRLDPEAGHVAADRVQIQQVLFNLLRNAVEAMEHSTRREIVITVATSGADMVEIGIADTGPGLAPEVRANLFRPFVTTKDNGMGVGLSICHSIVETHGGRLWAEDNPGGGTVFRFTLPRALAADAVTGM
jgi:two-component system, LuxR family, sensor kinase FixL